MNVGDRVKVKDEQGIANRGEYGRIARRLTDPEFNWAVLIDGFAYPVWYSEKNLFLIEVMTLEGVVKYSEHILQGYFIDTKERAIPVDELIGKYNGDDIRIVVERVKKEG